MNKLSKYEAFHVFQDYINGKAKYDCYIYDSLTVNEAIKLIQAGEKPESFVRIEGRKVHIV
jgi:hypothetical protein